MKEEVIYITSYNKEQKTLQDEVMQDYEEKCVVCGQTSELQIANILSEEIYTELKNETWNNIPLCKYCQMKLKRYNIEDSNGFKNLIKLIKTEYQKHLDWLK